MIKYEVIENTYCNGWGNTWTEYDEDNNEIPMQFDTYGEALTELENFIWDSMKEYERGNIAEPYDIDNYAIVEVRVNTYRQA